jgi:hypothetical protein
MSAARACAPATKPDRAPRGVRLPHPSTDPSEARSQGLSAPRTSAVGWAWCVLVRALGSKQRSIFGGGSTPADLALPPSGSKLIRLRSSSGLSCLQRPWAASLAARCGEWVCARKLVPARAGKRVVAKAGLLNGRRTAPSGSSRVGCQGHGSRARTPSSSAAGRTCRSTRPRRAGGRSGSRPR